MEMWQFENLIPHKAGENEGTFPHPIDIEYYSKL